MKRFEYGQLFVTRTPLEWDEDGDWKVKYWWHDGVEPTELFEVTNTVAVLSDLGAQGWDLVGPPEVSVFVSAFDSSDRDDADKRHRLEWGDWVTKRFWMRRELPET